MKKAKKIDEFLIFKLFLCIHGAFLICGSSGLEKIHFDIRISTRSHLKRRKSFQSMYGASGAFEAHASVSYKLQKASKYEKIDKNSKILKSRFMEGAFYLWSF